VCYVPRADRMWSLLLQVGEMSCQRFPDIDRFQKGSLMGGYIYLRFFNPVIVAPENNNFIQITPSKTARRNLILVAKLLQNLSNSMRFGDKEAYMMCLNDFIDRRLESMLVCPENPCLVLS